MSRKGIPFFATENDLTALARAVSSQRPLSFVVAGLADEPTTTILHDFDNHAPFATYLVCDVGATVRVRRVPQRGCADKYAVDQLRNPHTVSLQTGGMLGESRLTAGQVGTTTTDPTSEEIYALFEKLIREEFEKIKSYYVGREAVRLMDKGVRLTATSKSPVSYDLIR